MAEKVIAERIVRDCITRKDLKELPVGREVEFVLPEGSKIESASSTFTQMKLYGYLFTSHKVADVEKGRFSLFVTRLK